MSSSGNIHPEFERMLDRADKERLLGQRGHVLWLYGLSGSGKSAIANALERRLHDEGFFTQILDGDNIRAGLNSNLGFSDDDRFENIRRIAEVAKLFLHAGAVTLTAFITPRNNLRRMAREIVGSDNLTEVFVKCPYEVCARRDPKGLYARAHAGGVKDFTGRDSAFEEPDNPDLILDTGKESLESCVDIVYRRLQPLIRRN